MREYLDEMEGLKREASPYLCHYVVDDPLHTGLAERIVALLPADRQLGFYDPFYPSPSDPGAFIAVRQFDGAYVYSYGNHGWHCGWQRQSKEFLIQYLALCLPMHRPPAEERLSIERIEPTHVHELLKHKQA